MSPPNHPASKPADAGRHQPWRKLAALILIVAALGLPLNDLFRYALLVISVIAICPATLSQRRAAWVAALAVVAAQRTWSISARGAAG